MILYHLDREDSFPSDPSKQSISPFETNNTLEADEFFRSVYPKGISKVGERYLNTFDVDLSDPPHALITCENFRIYTIEYIFEIVRAFYFPDCPSRFASLFACKTIDDVRSWYGYLIRDKHDVDMSKATVKKIETPEKPFAADSSWRDMPLSLKSGDISYPVFNPFAYHMWAKHYWNGDTTASPRLEFLCRLPVTVVDTLPVSELINGTAY